MTIKCNCELVTNPRSARNLRRLDPHGAHDVGIEKGGRLGPAASLDEIQNMQMLARLLRQAPAVAGDVVLDQPSHPVDAPDGVQEELILRAGNERFVKIVVRLEY